MVSPLHPRDFAKGVSSVLQSSQSPFQNSSQTFFAGGDFLESGALSILGTESDSASPAALTPGSPFPPQACICTSLFLSACLNSIAFIFFKGLVRECLLDGDKSVV